MLFYNGIQKVIYSKLITTISGGQLKRIGRILIPIPFVSIIVLLSSKIFPVVYLFPYFDGTIIAPQNGKRICPPCKCPASVKFTSCGTSGKISGEWVRRIVGRFAPIKALSISGF